jgi:hypothetical protein
MADEKKRYRSIDELLAEGRLPPVDVKKLGLYHPSGYIPIVRLENFPSLPEAFPDKVKKSG